jgi:hypothetical protein
MYGSIDEVNSDYESDLKILGLTEELKDFDTFLNNIFRESRPWVTKSKLMLKLWKMEGKDITQYNFWESWFNSTDNFCEHMLSLYTKDAAYVGTTENIRTDLEKMLEISGELTDGIRQSINNNPKINSSIQVDYRKFYNDEQRYLVELSAKDFIEKFKYEF